MTYAPAILLYFCVVPFLARISPHLTGKKLFGHSRQLRSSAVTLFWTDSAEHRPIPVCLICFLLVSRFVVGFVLSLPILVRSGYIPLLLVYPSCLVMLEVFHSLSPEIFSEALQPWSQRQTEHCRLSGGGLLGTAGASDCPGLCEIYPIKHTGWSFIIAFGR